jgi:hypothetical protein
MPGFKPSTNVTQVGTTVQLQPVVLSINLTLEQRALILRATGQCPTKLELTASELKLILLPRSTIKDA